MAYRRKILIRSKELAMLRSLHAAELSANKKQMQNKEKPAELSANKKQKKNTEKHKPAEVVLPLPVQITNQGEEVRKLKKEKADSSKIAEAVKRLLELKAKLKAKVEEVNAGNEKIKEFRSGLEDLLLRKFFYVPSAEIYGGVGGLYDFGPTGCATKANLLELWRQHFVLTENMLEVATSVLTPEVVLKTSGHVAKFNDFMVRDVKTSECHRADKLLEAHIEKTLEDPTLNFTKEEKKEMLAARSSADAFGQKELDEALKKYSVKSPDTGNDISEPFPFNLMFSTTIGPTGKQVGYLRPETAQGIFVNFRRLIEYNGGRMPFAAAQIGLAFRNEISPRAGLLRVREFPMAEIEHFVDPDNKKHKNFSEVASIKLQLLGSADQTGEDISRIITVGEAVSSGLINNESLGYFMARTHLFLVKCGIVAEKLRFRQHKSTEMAHYACDCWDAEIYMQGYGWVECVGHADRAAFDLRAHTKATGINLEAEEQYDKPLIVEAPVLKLNKGIIGRTFKKTAKPLMEHLNGLSATELLKLQTSLKTGSHEMKLCTGEEYTLTAEMASVVIETKKISVRKYIPSVIEPSFGVGRILYAIFDHAYFVREKRGEKQGILRLSSKIAPIKCSILPIGNNNEFKTTVDKVVREFVALNISTKVDLSGSSIGRKYARADEVGVPFAICIDFDTFKDHAVTIRERDSLKQIRVSINEVATVVFKLVHGEQTWSEVYKQWPQFESAE